MVSRAYNRKNRHGLRIPELVKRYEDSNVAESKSSKTVKWYSEMLRSFPKYLATTGQPQDLSSFNVHTVRAYIIHLRSKSKYDGHPYTLTQSKPLSPKTVQCHVRPLKAFSFWVISTKAGVLPGVDTRGRRLYVNFCIGSGKGGYQVLRMPPYQNMMTFDMPSYLGKTLKRKSKALRSAYFGEPWIEGSQATNAVTFSLARSSQ